MAAKDETRWTTWAVRGAIALAALALAVVLLFPGIVPRQKYVEVQNDYATPPKGARRVLFVGNSHTFVHDVPHMVQRLVPKESRPLAFDALLSPGKTLAWHAAQGDVADEVAEHHYDVVVIQPQSTELVRTPRKAKAGLNQLAAQAGGTPVLFFQTWPRNPKRDRFAAQFGTMEEWNDTTLKNARATGRRVAPVGDVFLCTYHATRFDLWEKDGNHGSLAGSYVAALTLEHSLYPKAGWTRYAPPGLPANAARQLRDAAKKCMAESG